MMSALARRAAQVINDPTLQQWLLARLLGREKPQTVFTPHVPPCVDDRLPLSQESPKALFTALNSQTPDTVIVLPMPGAPITVAAKQAAQLFASPQDDLERTLALHRFAWLPLLGGDAPADWVAHIWQHWCSAFASPDDSWAWHPYTAAERAINLLDYGIGQGLPSPIDETVALLAAHAPAIASRLEYFGPHNTGNHLANNGRGLYRLGADLGLRQAREIGRDILLSEAANILTPCGVLREGSSHYHYLYTRNFLDCVLAAERGGFDQDAQAFHDIATRMLSACQTLRLAGRLPLIGDISPDCPPEFLDGLEKGTAVWPSLLGPGARHRVSEIAATAPADISLRDAGWHRLQTAGWQALWHVSQLGWSYIPGHGHQDIGAPEIHLNGVPVFIDPGRGAYGEDGDAARYRSAAVHGGLRIDDQDPYPANKPYYSDRFRKRIGGPSPTVALRDNVFELTYHGYRRYGINAVTRRWSFQHGHLKIADNIAGYGKHSIERALVTAGPVEIESNVAYLNITGQRLAVRAMDGAVLYKTPVTLWSAYGRGTAGFRLTFETKANAPWHGEILVEVLN